MKICIWSMDIEFSDESPENDREEMSNSVEIPTESVETDYELIAVVAEDSSRTIAVEGLGIPWHYPEDKKQFKALVENEHQLFGRKTFEQMTNPTKESIVLTHNENYSVSEPHIHVANSKEEAEKILSTFDDVVYNLGGSEIYELFFDECSKLIVSHIPEVADTEDNVAKKFPPILSDEWEITSVKEFTSFERVTYTRK